MREQIKEFKKGKLAINTKTQEEYDQLISIFDEYNINGSKLSN